MDWLTEDSKTFATISEEHAGSLRRNKLIAHRREMKRFLDTLNFLEFQELIEIWAKHVSRKQDKSISSRSEHFYKSQEWRRLRFLVLSERKSCELCGWGAAVGRKLHVDHKRARWLYPEFALDPENLQVLCEDCNMGKGITGYGPESRMSRPLKILIRRKTQRE